MKKSPGTTPGKGNTSFYKKMLNKFTKSNQPSKKWTDNAVKKGNDFSTCYKIMDCSSDLVPVSGRLEIMLSPNRARAARRIIVSIESCFIVTGFIETNGHFHMTWANSMC